MAGGWNMIKKNQAKNRGWFFNIVGKVNYWNNLLRVVGEFVGTGNFFIRTKHFYKQHNLLLLHLLDANQKFSEVVLYAVKEIKTRFQKYMNA